MTTAAVTTVRVWVPDVWDIVELEVNPDLTIAEIKASALERAMGKGHRADPENFIVKYRGAMVADEHVTLGVLGVPDRAPLIVLPARRRPVT